MIRLVVGVSLLALASNAEAYVGPGMGLGVLGALFGFSAAMLLAVVGLVWYPIKRMLRARRNGSVTTAAGNAAQTSSATQAAAGEQK